MAAGLVRSPWTRQGRLARQAGRSAYAAYVLHAPVLVLVSIAARPFPLPPEAKFVLVAAAGVLAAFLVGWAVTRSALLARFDGDELAPTQVVQDGRGVEHTLRG